MTRRDHVVLTALAGAGLLLALFQCWYAYLPPEDAALLDFCRFSELLDCYESLNRTGHTLVVWVVPVIPALAGVFLFQTALCGFAWTAQAASREAWIALARLASFPATGLAAFVLLNDYLIAKATSLSAVLVAGLCVAINVLTVLRGLEGARLLAGARWAALIALCAALFAFFVSGAGNARRTAARVRMELETAPPDVRVPAFAPRVPRAGAAAIGDPRAETEVLVFLDPAQESSRAVMRELAALEAEDVLVHVYAPGEAGARLMLAQSRGDLAGYLGDPKPLPDEELDPFRLHVERQQKAWRALGVDRLPAAVCRKNRWIGEVDLQRVLAGCR